jgi:hypothetical protein
MKKELRQLYGGRKPNNYLPAHNHVIHTPAFCHGLNGFRRFWIPPQWVGRGWSKCPCGWMSHRPEWETHYAHTDHAKWWRTETKKRGSLDAVYRHIVRQLEADREEKSWHWALEYKKPLAFEYIPEA